VNQNSVFFMIFTKSTSNPTVTRDTGIILPQLCAIILTLFAS